MNDPLRWYRALAGALFGCVTAMVIMALDIVHMLFGGRADHEYGNAIYYGLVLIGPVVGFIIGQRSPRGRNEE